MEIIVALLEGFEEIGELQDRMIAGCGETRDPGIEFGGRVNLKCLIGTKCWVDVEPGTIGRDFLVVRKIVARVVGGAKGVHAEFFEDLASGEFRGVEEGVCQVPNVFRGAIVERLGDAEVALQFEMSPMVERVAEGGRNGASPGEKLFGRRGVAGAIALVNSVGPHGAPFVMIALQPDFEQIIEAAIRGDVRGGKMGMVVEDGLALGIDMVELPSRI